MTLNNRDNDGGEAAQRMFGAQASAYAASQVHINDGRLTAVRRLADGVKGRWAIDLGTGAGFTAFAVADLTRWVVASDLTLPMLRETRRIGQERQLSNLLLSQNRAEALPIADGAIDLVTCRAAAHHFSDLDAALDEIQRILKPGGALVLADSVSPEDEELHHWLNDVELRRDFSHIENRKISVLERLVESRSLSIEERANQRTYHTFNDWVARTATPEDTVAALRRDFLQAARQVREAFEIQETAEGRDISFSFPALVFRAVKR